MFWIFKLVQGFVFFIAKNYLLPETGRGLMTHLRGWRCRTHGGRKFIRGSSPHPPRLLAAWFKRTFIWLTRWGRRPLKFEYFHEMARHWQILGTRSAQGLHLARPNLAHTLNAGGSIEWLEARRRIGYGEGVPSLLGVNSVGLCPSQRKWFEFFQLKCRDLCIFIAKYQLLSETGKGS